MKKIISTLLAGTSALALSAVGFATTSYADTVTYPCGPSVGQQKYCDYLDQRFAKDYPGNTSKRVNVPWDSTSQLTLYQQTFAAKSGSLDVINTDVVWPGMLSKHLFDLTPYTKGVKYFPGYEKNNVVNGKLLALPQFADTSFLLYRKDLLEKYHKPIPKTYAELKATAEFIQNAERKAGNSKMWGYVFQGKAYEGLTCNALEWVSAYGGGGVVESDGTISIDNPQAAKAFDEIASFVGTISPKGVLGYMEEDARGVFQNGNAVFMRNWAYALKLANGKDSVIKNKVDFTMLPMGEGLNARHSASLGGWGFSVSKYSKHAALAAKWVVMATDKDGAIQRHNIEGQMPAIPELYSDPSMDSVARLKPVLQSAVPRPATPTKSRYNQVSKEFWNAAYNTLSGTKTGAQAVKSLAHKLKRIKKHGWK